MSERQIDYQLDACGLQCPGPILKLYNKVSEMKDGEVVEIKATDLGFAKDIQAWTKSTGNTLLDLNMAGGKVIARVQKGLGAAVRVADASPPCPLLRQGKT